MPRGFSEKEKMLIQESLLENGKRLFTAYGLKKTSIADITQAAGIAQGSFYNFFGSKEELYFAILELEERTLKEKLLTDLQPFDKHPRQYLRNLLVRSLEMVEDYPLMTRLYLDNTMDLLVRKLPDEQVKAHFERDHDDLLPFIEMWQSRGILRGEKPETITAAIRAIMLLSLHKQEIGESVYSDTMALLIDLVSDGLVLKENEDE